MAKAPRSYIGSNPIFGIYALMAQLVEQLICNQQVGGSSPSGGFKGGYTVGVAG